jgi:hypothetical protein
VHISTGRRCALVHAGYAPRAKTTLFAGRQIEVPRPSAESAAGDSPSAPYWCTPAKTTLFAGRQIEVPRPSAESAAGDFQPIN